MSVRDFDFTVRVRVTGGGDASEDKVAASDYLNWLLIGSSSNGSQGYVRTKRISRGALMVKAERASALRSTGDKE